MKGKFILLAILLLANPLISSAQPGGGEMIYSLNGILNRLFEEMLPLCSRLIDVGRAIAGFAALFYIAMRVWKHIASAEPIDFFPLLRPFAIGMAIMLFPHLIAMMNGVLKPLETATRAMATDSHKAILYHIEQREGSIMETPPVGYQGGDTDVEKYEQPSGSDQGGFFSGLENAFSVFSLRSAFKELISELFHILYAAASLCINVIRTFYLIVLAIIGPIALGLSVFDGFQNSLSNWFARYIHVWMWLPVANIFGAICSKILENMMVLDQGILSTTAYLIFMVIAIIGYATVPNVAGYIVQPGGEDTLLHKVNQATQTAAKAAVALV